MSGAVRRKSDPVSNPEKVLYPAVGFTKADVVAYYLRVAPAMVPHLRNRPVTLRRYPDGVRGKSSMRRMPRASRPHGFAAGSSLVWPEAPRFATFS